jgi:hypothetical protein
LTWFLFTVLIGNTFLASFIIFDPLLRAKKCNKWTKIQDHVRNINRTIGPLPKDTVIGGNKSKGLSKIRYKLENCD